MNRVVPKLLGCFAWLAAASLLLFPANLRAQGITTSALEGQVLDVKSGQPIGEATVDVVHVPSGTEYRTTTRSNGRYALSGLRPGGPYTITVTGEALRTAERRGVFLELGRAGTEDFGMESDVVQMEPYVFEADRDPIFGAGKIGTGTELSRDELETISSVRRNVQDVARLDSRLILQSLDQGGQLSAQGQNFRYNSFLIDGVQANDSFGLNSNGFTSLRSPVPTEALQAFSVDLTPVDVRRAGFTGALINVVTKSGTNKFEGMTYYEFTNESMRAKNPVSGAHEPFDERTWGAVLGGPIVPGKLFFFLSYDDFQREAPPPNQVFVPDGTVVESLRSYMATQYDYDIGTFDPSNISDQKTYIAKIDWNINRNHQATFSYNKNDGQDTVFSSFDGNTTTSFSSYWYDQPRLNESYTARLSSNWSPALRTEFSASLADYDGSPSSRSPAAFPEILINGIPGTRTDGGTVDSRGGQLRFGTEFSRQLNAITTRTSTYSGFGEYSTGDHSFLAGFDWENRDIVNKFTQAWQGQYTYTNAAAAMGGTGSLLRVILAPGATPEDAIANFDLSVLGLFVQDNWKPNRNLTVTAGLRFDLMGLPDDLKPIPDAGAYSEAIFQRAFGVASTTLPDGNNSISPRLGFVYDFDMEKKTQVRGSMGLYRGLNPAVWISNAYSNRGVTARQTVANAPFVRDVTPVASTQPLPSNAIPTINVTDPDFNLPLVWKGNIAIDRTTPWWGTVATLEFGLTDTEYVPFVTDMNLKKVGTMPDGRDRYAGRITNVTSGSTGPSRSSASNPYGDQNLYQNPQFADVFNFTNSEKGGGWEVTAALNRKMRDNWAAGISWTHGDYTEVSPMTSSVAQSNYNGRAIYNPNEDVASTSNYSIDNRVVAQVTRKFEFIRNAPTTVSVIYEGRTGRPYSWVFYGDANGDGFTFNDLFYVPDGPGDTKVRWTNNEQRDAFFAFAAESGLDQYAGQVAPRNSERSPWQNTIDLKFIQTIPLHGRFSADLYLNLINFANLLDSDWGILEEVPFSYRRAVAGTTFDTATNQYVYNFTSSTLNPVPVVVNQFPVSRWQVQAGVRLRF